MDEAGAMDRAGAMDEAGRLIAAVEDGTLEAEKFLLHPYLHWAEGPLRLRGRVTVLAHLAGRSSLARPESYELRDGQIYRWVGPPA